MQALEAKTRADFPLELLKLAETPCYVISKDAVEQNCRILQQVMEQSGARILLALKAFALPALFPLISGYLHGVCASGPIEARLGREDFGREVHTYAPAFNPAQMERVARYSDYVIFNSISQWQAHQAALEQAGHDIRAGLRVNPGHAEVEVELYNPCLPGSRFGLSPQDLEGADLTGISGLHFHALCEQNADVLVRVLASFEKRFGRYLAQMEWLNLGGGHHITREDYDRELLGRTIRELRARYKGLRVYLEPGEAVVLNSGVFVTRVLDIINNGMDIAILDCSAETHMPDVLAMPYRPQVIGGAEPNQKPHTYRLGGISCLAGDIIGDYSFDEPLRVGQRLVLTDMALYSFVKNTTFNGVELPAIYTCSAQEDSLDLVRRFGYKDYRSRLA